MNIKDTSNREIGRQLEMDRNEATVLVWAFLKRYQEREHRKSWKTYKIDEGTNNWVLELIEDRCISKPDLQGKGWFGCALDRYLKGKGYRKW